MSHFNPSCVLHIPHLLLSCHKIISTNLLFTPHSFKPLASITELPISIWTTRVFLDKSQKILNHKRFQQWTRIESCLTFMELSSNGFPGWRARSLDSVSGHEQKGRRGVKQQRKAWLKRLLLFCYGSILVNAITVVAYTELKRGWVGEFIRHDKYRRGSTNSSTIGLGKANHNRKLGHAELWWPAASLPLLQFPTCQSDFLYFSLYPTFLKSSPLTALPFFFFFS